MITKNQPVEVSPEDVLNLFYIEYFKWLKAGAPQAQPFSKDSGLCLNIRVFIGINELVCEEYNALEKFKEQLKIACLDQQYPFGGSEVYGDECNHGTHHKNTLRIKWIENHVKAIT